MNLQTRYLGLDLRNPLVASAGPLTQTVDGIRALADAGVGAVVMYSLFEEQLRAEVRKAEALLDAHENSFAEALDYFPDTTMFTTRSVAHAYLTLVENGAKAIDVPLIASLNGSDTGGWVSFAKDLSDAGASALELNIYLVPGDLGTRGTDVIERHLEIVRAVKASVSIPVSVKMSPYFSSVGSVALRILDAGADGLVLFNRFLQPDIDLDTFNVSTTFALSTPDEGRLPRTWIAALRKHTPASLAGSTGVETSADVIKYVLAGADVVMTTASLLRHGPGHVTVLLEGLEAWLSSKDLTLEAARGALAVPAELSANDYERAGYLAALDRAKSVYGSLTNA